MYGGNGEIISASIGLNLRERADTRKQNIITDDKKDRGQRTTLFNPTTNINPNFRCPPEGWSDSDVVKKADNQFTKPARKPDTFDRFVNEGMVHRVECLGSIHKKDEIVPPILVASLCYLVEILIKLPDVILENSALNEAFLERMKDCTEGRGDGADNSLSDNSVVSVSDRDGSSVRRKKSALF
jgi:hypothetical protein